MAHHQVLTQKAAWELPVRFELEPSYQKEPIALAYSKPSLWSNCLLQKAVAFGMQSVSALKRVSVGGHLKKCMHIVTSRMCWRKNIPSLKALQGKSIRLCTNNMAGKLLDHDWKDPSSNPHLATLDNNRGPFSTLST